MVGSTFSSPHVARQPTSGKVGLAKKSKKDEVDVLEFANKYTIGGKYSLILIEKVWERICNFIASSLFLKRAVHITDLGVFTFFEFAAPTSATFYVFMHRPLFHMNKKLAESYDLKCVRLHGSDNAAIDFPNYTAIASLVPCPRSAAEEIKSGIVAAIRHLCKMHMNLRLTMPGLGTFYVRNKYVDMNFSCNFVERLHRNIINPVNMANTRRNGPVNISQTGSPSKTKTSQKEAQVKSKNVSSVGCDTRRGP